MKKQFLFSFQAICVVVSILACVSTGQIEAKVIGGDPPNRAAACTTCGCNCSSPSTAERSDTSSSISRSEGNLTETVPVSMVRSSNGPTLPLNATYNSYNADGSRAIIDTVMGYGWTHSFNIFLFTQVGSMFKFGSDGRVTRYSIAPGSKYATAPGYFETLVKNPDGSFTLTTKDQTVSTFKSIPGSHFLVGGPVWLITSMVDRNGNTTTFTYTSGNLTSVSDTYGRTITFTYNGSNHIASIRDPDGRTTTFQYDSTSHLLAQITDPNGKTIQYGYNVLYQITSKLDKAGRTFNYIYSNFLPIAVYDVTNTGPATFSNPNNWAVNPLQLSISQMRVYTPSTTSNTDGRGNVWKDQYDSNGYIAQETAPDGATTKYTYDPATLQLASMTDANGNTSTFTYDANGNMLTVTDSLGHVTSYTYDATFNLVTSVTDPRGRVTTYTIDPSNGNRLQVTDPLGQTEKWTYDSHGNTLTYTDKDGNVTKYQYDAFGDRIQTIDAIGDITIMTYDSVGNVTSITDANSHTTTYQYDGMNRVIVVTDATGHTDQTIYDGEGNRVETIDRNGHTTTYIYDQRQRLVETTDALSQNEVYAYDGNNNRTSLTDKNGHTTTYQYDVQNRLTQVTDALSHTSTTTYDEEGNVTSQTDANTHTTTYTYDQLNRRATMSDPLGEKTLYFYDGGTFTGPVTLGTVSVTCNECGATPGSNLITAEVDADGTGSLHAGTMYFKYDALDRVVISERKTGCIAGPTGAGCPDTITASDAVKLYTYDAQGNRLTVTEADANTTSYQYDADNRQIQQTNAAGDVTTTTYDAVGNIKSITDPNMNVVSNTYDSLNRVMQITDSAGLVGTFSYDPVGNRLTQSDGDGNTTSYTYDAINRLTAATDPLGKATTYQYDAVGNLLKTIDRNTDPTTYSYDAINRRLSMTDALGNTTQWVYDPVGNLIILTDANSHATQYGYDAVNRPIQETYADSLSRSYTYDFVGNLLTRTDQNAQTTKYTYNDLYFTVTRAYPTSGTDTFTYDLSGRMLSGQHGSWPTTFSYDGANRMLKSVQNGQTVTYSYNIPGRTRTLTYPSGRVITEHIDFRWRMDHIDDAGSPPSIVQYTYDLSNNVLNRNFRNGTTSSFSYNANNWMTTVTHNNGSTFAGFNYAYDNEGNRQFEQKAQDTTHSEAYQYDSTYRLITYSVGTLVGSTVPVPSTQTTYSLDPVGNWNSKTTNAVTQNRTHNATNELTKIDSTALTYDNNGNLTSDGAYSYTYDEENRVIQIQRLFDSVIVGQYQYDALNRRVQRIADPAGTAITTLFFYDDQRIIEEQNSANSTQATYVYGNYMDEILSMTRAGQTYYYHQNAMWSIEAITNSTGVPVECYAYDAYGSASVNNCLGTAVPPNAWGTPHSAIGNPWMFTGRQFDEESGVYYYRARSYDPAKGRFLQRDPDESVNATNLYEYGLDNPLKFLDPLGRQAKPYDQMSREELMKVYDDLASRWAALDTLAHLDPQGEFARKYKITPAQIRDAQDKLKKMKAIQEELDRRRQAAGACPGRNPCQVFWTIMNLAGEYDVISEGISNIETIYNVATIGGFKLVTESGKTLTKKEIAAQLAKWAAPKIAEALGVPVEEIPYAKKLLSDVLNPQNACFALAECEAKVNGRSGFWQRKNALGNVIRSCTWDTKGVNWYKSGWLVNLQMWLGL